MPEISRFFGIIIAMYYGDHAPPHFHVRYGDETALIAIESLVVLRGRLSRRAQGMVTEWGAQHQDELMENWRLASNQQPLNPIAPLD